MLLDLSSLKKAIDAFEALVQEASEPHALDQLSRAFQEGIQSGVIQHFEFTYELCWKMMKRWLEINIGRDAIQGIPQRELFRHGVENKLIDDAAVWWAFHQFRNQTSHTYDEEVADEVYNAALDFVQHAKQLYSRLDEKNG